MYLNFQLLLAHAFCAIVLDARKFQKQRHNTTHTHSQISSPFLYEQVKKKLIITTHSFCGKQSKPPSRSSHQLTQIRNCCLFPAAQAASHRFIPPVPSDRAASLSSVEMLCSLRAEQALPAPVFSVRNWESLRQQWSQHLCFAPRTDAGCEAATATHRRSCLLHGGQHKAACHFRIQDAHF